MEITYTRKGDYLYPNLTLDPVDDVELGKYNIKQAQHVVWSAHSVCKRNYDGRISRAELDACKNPCQESNLHDLWSMSAGYHQTGETVGKPIHMTLLRGGSLAVLTTRRPSDKESERLYLLHF